MNESEGRLPLQKHERAICIYFLFLDSYKQSKKVVVSPLGSSEVRAPRLPWSNVKQIKL